MTNVLKFHSFPATKSPFHGLIDEFMNRGLGDYIGSDSLTSQPLVNVTESDLDFQIHFAAPGFDKKDFTLQIENDSLTVSATREKTTEAATPKFVRREFQYSDVKRTFKLPKTVNQDAISAVYENGILLVAIPKQEPVQPAVKSITIG